MTEHSPLLWTMEQDEPPDECWYVIQDAEGHVVCFATKDDAEVIIRAVNNHAQLAEALEYATKWIGNIMFASTAKRAGGLVALHDAMPDKDKGVLYLKAALSAAKEGEG